jgi:predicted glycogen debranching enzyme
VAELEHFAEWLETDGLGGFASGTVGGIRTRRYHGILVTALAPPVDRHVLVSGLEIHVVVGNERWALSSQRYSPDVVHPDGIQRLLEFRLEPWPTWRFRLGADVHLRHELVMLSGVPLALVTFRLEGELPGARLELRPLLAMRPFHALTREHAGFRFDPEFRSERVSFLPHSGSPGVSVAFDGSYQHEPSWYRNFCYSEERARGLDAEEDLASPGTFHHDFERGEAALVFARTGPDVERVLADRALTDVVREIRERERLRRNSFATPLARAADQFFVRRGTGRTLVAGYPWFGDWGRDTFIALRGLALASDRFEDAREILLEWASSVDAGMLPNRFSEQGEHAEYNSVDASLWFVVVVGELLQLDVAGRLSPAERNLLTDAALAIVDGYAQGTRHGIRWDEHDGLLAAGAPGVQLTWMDAKVGEWVVTPRIGKPVEVQALWIHALGVAGGLFERWKKVAERARTSFERRFWDDARGCLMDVVDVDHVAGSFDTSFRPNQILAVGGLPQMLLPAPRARRLVDAVEQRLWTPLGLRSLDREDRAYRPRYEGGVNERDGSYHQGTVWPWLLGPFVEAWVRVRGSTAEAKRDARERFLTPVREHLRHAGLGHVSEITDAEPPFTPRGCPFQAWSLGELMRIERLLG